jgi:hypothetical protein
MFISLLRWLTGFLFGSDFFNFHNFHNFLIQITLKTFKKKIYINFYRTIFQNELGTDEKIKIGIFFQTNENPGQFQTLTME